MTNKDIEKRIKELRLRRGKNRKEIRRLEIRNIVLLSRIDKYFDKLNKQLKNK